MGFAECPAMQHTLTWADVYARQQSAQASLVLVIGATEKEESGRYFHEWQFESMNNAACSIQCAWDPTIWRQPSQSAMVHLADDRYAMSIQLTNSPESGAPPPTGSEAFQLILTKLTGGTQASDWKLIASVTEECWRKLINTAISSQRWIIAGDLASSSGATMFNRFVNNTDHEVRKLKVDVVTSVDCDIDGWLQLAVIGCNMDLGVAHALGDSQSMVINIQSK